MKFIDEVQISVASGSGGDGLAHFRRKKNVPFGGPDGGDGGDGGSIFLQSDGNINTLLNFRGRKYYQAQNGGHGSGNLCSGRKGKDLVLKVPLGTIVRERISGHIIADLKRERQTVLIAKGGRGGVGNHHFKSPTNRTPTDAMSGGTGEQLQLELELKLLADIALIGLPNAGKSTLISSLCAARPKIADYPFTTLRPHLGVVKTNSGGAMVLADTPGLIANASSGRGLGIKFLKHIERARAFVHLIDISECPQEYAVLENYVTIRNELGHYNPALLQREEIVCLSKSDACDAQAATRYRSFLRRHLRLRQSPLIISAACGHNLAALKNLMSQKIAHTITAE